MVEKHQLDGNQGWKRGGNLSIDVCRKGSSEAECIGAHEGQGDETGIDSDLQDARLVPDEAAVEPVGGEGLRSHLIGVAIDALLPQIESENGEDNQGKDGRQPRKNEVEENAEEGEASQKRAETVEGQDGLALRL